MKAEHTSTLNLMGYELVELLVKGGHVPEGASVTFPFIDHHGRVLISFRWPTRPEDLEGGDRV